MKLLFDQNRSFKLCSRLTDLFPDSSQVQLLGLAQADDGVIWEQAKANGFVLSAKDSDFADRASLYGPPPKVIWLRCGNQKAAFIGALLRTNGDRILQFEQEPETGCLELY
jgi:predicted nuclease of predicted toxin-antitoxin system